MTWRYLRLRNLELTELQKQDPNDFIPRGTFILEKNLPEQRHEKNFCLRLWKSPFIFTSRIRWSVCHGVATFPVFSMASDQNIPCNGDPWKINPINWKPNDKNEFPKTIICIWRLFAFGRNHGTNFMVPQKRPWSDNIGKHMPTTQCQFVVL